MEKKIIFTTVKNISPKDKEKLCKNGYLVVEVKMLSELKYSSDIENNILLDSSMKAIDDSCSNVTQSDFFKNLYKKMYLKK